MELKKKEILVGITILILLVSIFFIFIFKTNSDLIEKESMFTKGIIKFTGTTNNNTIGYEYITPEILHFWNAYDDYYLNISSGIQFSNLQDEFWTHNIWCLAYKTTSWNYNCGDSLPMVMIPNSDNSSYVQITGSKNITIGGKTVQFDLTYDLRLNNLELNITPSITNVAGGDITNELAFAWRVNQIKIDNDEENDRIFVNKTWYDLSQPLDLLFINMTEEVLIINDTQNQTCIDERDATKDCVLVYSNYTVFKPLANYKLQDKSYVNLRWNPNLDYFLQVKNKTGQFNAPVTLAVITTGLNIGQTKKTSFFWRDPAPIVTLHRPIDGATDQIENISFSANITQASDDLKNFTLYHNITGTWSANQTLFPTLPNNNTDDKFLGINMTGNVLLLHFDNDSNFGENNAQFHDYSGSMDNNNITLTNWDSDEIQDGKIGLGINVDASDIITIVDDGIHPLDSATGAGQARSWGYWIILGTLANKLITDKSNFAGNSFWNEQQTGGGLHINGGVTPSGFLSTGTMDSTNWHHIVFTHNGTHTFLYLDGTLEDGPNAQTAPGDNNNDLKIAAHQSNGGFGGQMDEFFIFNRSLSANEVATIYNVTKNYKVNFTVENIPDGTYIWNVEAINNASSSASASSNFTFTVGAVAPPSADSCNYTTGGGTWQVRCSDNCVIVNATDLGGNILELNDSGSFNIQTTISGVSQVQKINSCMVNENSNGQLIVNG